MNFSEIESLLRSIHGDQVQAEIRRPALTVLPPALALRTPPAHDTFGTALGTGPVDHVPLALQAHLGQRLRRHLHSVDAFEFAHDAENPRATPRAEVPLRVPVLYHVRRQLAARLAGLRQRPQKQEVPRRVGETKVEVAQLVTGGAVALVDLLAGRRSEFIDIGACEFWHGLIRGE